MIHIANKTYEVLVDHKNGWRPEAFRDRYSEVLDRYDYVVGDWGYSQLRLRGFFKDAHPKGTKDTVISTIQDYLNEYCNFGCAYFIIEKVATKEPSPSDPAVEPALREEEYEQALGARQHRAQERKDQLAARQAAAVQTSSVSGDAKPHERQSGKGAQHGDKRYGQQGGNRGQQDKNQQHDGSGRQGGGYKQGGFRQKDGKPNAQQRQGGQPAGSPRQDRGERSERGERQDRGERPDRGERKERQEQGSRPNGGTTPSNGRSQKPHKGGGHPSSGSNPNSGSNNPNSNPNSNGPKPKPESSRV
ncbi:Uncharacterized protein YutD [Paenibacillus sp. UNCCL117]|uniref:YutD-like domain-containing protein n=1 Tax=unclassified Paenibacillus TaxID=185978 RepID=UPI00088542C0|nr:MULTISPECIES: YutD-like domain-containing protein [unclassified Paenibacillus]SDE01521.1 Uncharacterized protein YutD [Paenibacillus sp. cl123]SFW57013.1 Uncharacterized protein YutD [Paenibacillus sp. UNCCL117]